MQRVLEFCGEHQIFPDVEIIKANKIMDAYDSLYKNNSGSLRYVIDIKESLQDETYMPHREPDAILGNLANSGPGAAAVYLTVRTCGECDYRPRVDAMIEAIEQVE